MRRLIATVAAVLVVIVLLTSAFAEGKISTTVLMRVSRMTQNAVVNAGEDLSIEVSIDGAQPAQYQWYFNDAPIEGANQKVFNIANAQPEHTGVYRLDAFDESELTSAELSYYLEVTNRVNQRLLSVAG